MASAWPRQRSSKNRLFKLEIKTGYMTETVTGPVLKLCSAFLSRIPLSKHSRKRRFFSKFKFEAFSCKISLRAFRFKNKKNQMISFLLYKTLVAVYDVRPLNSHN